MQDPNPHRNDILNCYLMFSLVVFPGTPKLQRRKVVFFIDSSTPHLDATYNLEFKANFRTGIELYT